MPLAIAALLTAALLLLAGYAGDELRQMRERAEVAERRAASTEIAAQYLEERLQRSGERAMQCRMLLDTCCDATAVDATGRLTATPRSKP